jgi:GR25 family glycosyltransferase involved in LPS biosynthesis
MTCRIFVINMKKSTERLAFMSEQLGRLGLSFEVQVGVDGKTHDFSDVYDEELSQRLNGTPLALVEKGCALSHRLILERVVSEHIPYTLILEDDVELPLHFKDALTQELKKQKEGQASWEYLAFNYPTVGWKFVKLWLFLLGEQFRKRPSVALYVKLPVFFIKFLGILTISVFEGLRDRLYKKIYPVGAPVKFYRPMYLAGCYLVTEEGAKKLLEVQTKLIYPADRIQNIARVTKGLKLFWFVPLLVKQRRDKFESTMYQNKDYVFKKYD